MPSLSFEHGLSLHIQRRDDSLLFDMGQSGIFAQNAKALGVDLSAVDAAFLSHGHYDHGGGLERFLEENGRAPVYMAEDAFGAHFSGKERYIGLDPALKEDKRIVFCKEEVRPLKDATFFPAPLSALPDTFDGRMLKKEGDAFLTDGVSHERCLLLKEEGKRVLIGGCCHKGVLSLLEACPADYFIGGFHFMKVETDSPAGRSLLEKAAKRMLETKTLFFTGHCTGEEQFAFLKERMGDRLLRIRTGDVIEIS